MISLRKTVRFVLRGTRHVYRTHLADHIDRLLAFSDRPDFVRVWKEVSPVLQQDHRPTARRLYELARFTAAMPGTIVELGSFEGNSTVYLAMADGTVHAVDPHTRESMVQTATADEDTSERFQTNLRRFGVRDRVVYHRLTSTDAAAKWNGRPVRFLFIDALHTYDAVVADYEAWRPHLAPRHVVLFDDFLWREVEQAVRDLRSRHRPPFFYVRGGQAIFSTEPLPLRVAGLP